MWAVVPAALALDLEEARRLVEEQAIAVQVAAAEADGARSDAAVAFGGALPQIVGFADLNVGAGLTSIGFDRPVPWQAGVGVSASWALLDPSTWSAAASARQTASGREALLAWARVTARRNVTTAFSDVLAAEVAAGALKGAADDAERAQRAVDALVAAQVRPPPDGARARADALDWRARALQATGNLRAGCAALQGLIGQPITGTCVLEPVDWEAPGEAATEHPAMIASMAALGAAKAGRSSAVWDQLPSLAIQGTAAEYVVPERGAGAGWSATIGVDVPLTFPTGGAASIRSATAQTRRAEAQLEGQRRDLEVARVQAEVTYDAALAALDARVQATKAALDAWSRVNARYQEGLDGVTSWLTARRARVQAEIDEAAAQAALGRAIANLEAARGVY